MNGLINTIANNKKITSKIISILVGAVLVVALIWGLVALVSVGDVEVKVQMTFWSLAGLLLGVVLGFHCVQKGDSFVSMLGFIGLIASALSFLLQLLTIWVIPSVEVSKSFTTSFTIMGQIMLASTVTAVAFISAALIMKVEENGNSIGTLKIAAGICDICVWLATMTLIFVGLNGDFEMLLKLSSLSSVTVSCFVVCALMAVLISWLNRREKIDELLSGKANEMSFAENNAGSGGLSPDIIELNVQKRLEKEKAKAELDAMPPLQSDEMAPTVSRDNELIIGNPLPNMENGQQAISGQGGEQPQTSLSSAGNGQQAISGQGSEQSQTSLSNAGNGQQAASGQGGEQPQNPLPN